MISADIPMTMNSTADLSLSLPDFIEYSIKNDLNIVTTKWLAHIRKITITEARSALKSFWNSIGKGKGYCATFSVLSQSEDSYSMELIDFDKLDDSMERNVLSSEIYAIHAIPLKDKSVQFGMINVPIFDVAGEIEAPWIDKTENTISYVQSGVQNAQISSNKPASSTTTPNTQPTVINPVENEVASQPPGKKMKMVQKTRTFMHDGYQQVETYNELVPCDDNEPEIAKTQPTQPAAPAKAKQSSMMSFFKKK